MMLKFCIYISLLIGIHGRADILLDLNQQIPFLPPQDTTAGLRLKNVSIPFKANIIYLRNQFLIGAGYENSSSEPLQSLTGNRLSASYLQENNYYFATLGFAKNISSTLFVSKINLGIENFYLKDKSLTPTFNNSYGRYEVEAKFFYKLSIGKNINILPNLGSYILYRDVKDINYNNINFSTSELIPKIQIGISYGIGISF